MLRTIVADGTLMGSEWDSSATAGAKRVVLPVPAPAADTPSRNGL